MSERPLLLSPAKTGVLIKSHEARIRLVALCFGIFAVLVGAADVTSRLAKASLGDAAGIVAFGPAISIADPSVLGTTATSTATGAITPVRLRIPAIGVDAKVEQVGQKADGTMGTPTKFGEVAWYQPGSKPGASGNAVFAGHVDNALTTAGVFEHLSQVKQGDYVSVSDESGKTLLYRVSSIKTYQANTAPVDQIFKTTGTSELVLITCAGDWVTSEHQFDQRLVVVATPSI